MPGHVQTTSTMWTTNLLHLFPTTDMHDRVTMYIS